MRAAVTTLPVYGEESYSHLLWRGVFDIAVYDATIPFRMGEGALKRGDNARRFWDAMDAMYYLFSGDRDDIIQRAEIDPPVMRKRLVELIREGDAPWNTAQKYFVLYSLHMARFADDIWSEATDLGFDLKDEIEPYEIKPHWLTSHKFIETYL